MQHLGDITKISGYNTPTVDCIIGGSPCQDLSVAGKRAGLAGERSGLFMEQIRIVKEMRERDRESGRSGRDVRPRYMVWENVPGAFSSNKGEDFRAVLEEIAKVADKSAVIPEPPKGKWQTSGCIMGDGWSIAWRVLDAQFWGVPQRRRRIALVADFGGESAPEILFERKGVCGDFAESGEARQGTTGDSEGGTGTARYTLKIRSGCEGGGKGALIQAEKSSTMSTHQDQTLFAPSVGCFKYKQGSNARSIGFGENISPTVDADGGHPNAVCYGIGGYNSEGMLSDNPHSGIYEASTSRTLDLNGGNPACNQGGIAVCEPHVLDMTHACDVIRDCGETVPTLQSRMGTGGNKVPLVQTYQKVTGPLMANSHPGSYCGQDAFSDMFVTQKETANTVGTKPYQDRGENANLIVSAVDVRNNRETGETFGTLQAKENGGQSLNYMGAVRNGYIVRRLTPMECERLQGYPDGWTDIGEWTDSKGKVHKEASDSARYKALGNSISLPNWKYVIKRISAQFERDATMASLFDGIGGFPYLWEQINGKGSCLWASEIEEFPIAVTKVRFGND